MRFPSNIHKELKNYIYAYYDPTNGTDLPFYIGRSVRKYLRASGSSCHYSYNKKGDVYKFDNYGKILNA